MPSSKGDIIKHKLRVKSYELRVTSHELRVESLKVQAESLKARVDILLFYVSTTPLLRLRQEA